MAYEKQTWANGAAGKTPLSAERLNHIEDGLAAVEGTPGPAGPAGPAGEKGATGAAGAKGADGTTPPAGTAAQLTAGTDTVSRSWSAKDLTDFFAKKA